MLLKLWFLYSRLGASTNADFKNPIPTILNLAWGTGICILTRHLWAVVVLSVAPTCIISISWQLVGNAISPGPHPVLLNQKLQGWSLALVFKLALQVNLIYARLKTFALRSRWFWYKWALEHAEDYCPVRKVCFKDWHKTYFK